MKFLGSNGKGYTRSYALASAYAEFMERIQNMYLIKNHYGLFVKSLFLYPDAKLIPLAKVLELSGFPFLVENLKEENIKNLEEPLENLPCYPFFNVSEKIVEYLPLELIDMYCYSTGCCSGNTPEEAIVQGICEVFERFVSKQAFFKGLALPTVPLSQIKGLAIEGLVKELIDGGYHIIIKDATMGGIFPVICVIIFNRERTAYKIKFGSDPIFEIALMRCLDELAQGFDAQNFGSSLLPIVWAKENIGAQKRFKSKLDPEFIKFHRDSFGQFPHSIFSSHETSTSFINAFVKSYTNHKHLLEHLTRIIINQGYRLYVRDVSFLGFPSYRVYVPNMSEKHSLSFNDFKFMINAPRFYRRVFLGIRGASKRALKKLAEFLEYEYETKSFSMGKFYNKIAGIYDRSTSSDYFSISPRALLALLHICVKDYKRAFFNLNRCLLDDRKDFNISKIRLDNYYSSLLLALRFKVESMPEQKIQKSLITIYGEDIAARITAFFKNPEEVLHGLPFPTCGNCSTCMIKGSCCYPEWERIQAKLYVNMEENPLDQYNLSPLFDFC